jgi:hypothetical protein
MKPERFIVVTTLEEQEITERALSGNTTPAERFAMVERLREGCFALHGRPQPGLARVLVVVDFPPREVRGGGWPRRGDSRDAAEAASGRAKDLADLALLGAPQRARPRRRKR